MLQSVSTLKPCNGLQADFGSSSISLSLLTYTRFVVLSCRAAFTCRQDGRDACVQGRGYLKLDYCSCWLHEENPDLAKQTIWIHIHPVESRIYTRAMYRFDFPFFAHKGCSSVLSLDCLQSCLMITVLVLGLLVHGKDAHVWLISGSMFSVTKC